jgi:multidrug efflux pump subunit AcrA (membrane-fusion protein)
MAGLRSMSRFRGRRAAIVLFLASASSSIVVLLVQSRSRSPTSISENKPRESMRSLVGRGSVWIDPSRVVRCRVEGPVSIIKLVAEGTDVKKGDLVCELDASGLGKRLGQLAIIARSAEGEFRNARVAREAAEIAVNNRFPRKTTIPDATGEKLERDLDRKRTDERVRWSAWEAAEDRFEACRDQIALCKLYAQADGPVVLAGVSDPNAHGKRLQEGAIVERPDEILSVFDVDGAIRLMTKVPEKLLEEVKTGQQARIAFDAFPQKLLSGVVAEISPMPDPSTGGRLAGFYTVGVEIARGFPGLRPDMRARVEILLDGLDERPGAP